MGAYLKLEGYFTEHLRSGMAVGSPLQTVKLGNGTTVDMPVPYLPIGRGLGITPVVEPHGDACVRIDFTLWAPLRYGHDLVAGFPFAFNDQDLAVRAARAFNADPHTSWQDTRDQVEAWLRAWSAANGIGPVPTSRGQA